MKCYNQDCIEQPHYDAMIIVLFSQSNPPKYFQDRSANKSVTSDLQAKACYLLNDTSDIDISPLIYDLNGYLKGRRWN